MDATQVLSQLTSTWTGLLDQYYDHVASEHLKNISKEYNIPIEELQTKTLGLKEQIMKSLSKCMEQPTEEKKEQPKKAAPAKKEEKKTGELDKLGRKELQELCKQKGIPTKRKNSDMVNAIREYDEKNKQEPVEEPKEEPKEELKPEEPKEEPDVALEAEIEELKKAATFVPEEESEPEPEEENYFNHSENEDMLHEDEYVSEDDF